MQFPKTHIKPPRVLHGTSIKTPSVGLHESTNKCRYRGLQNRHETYIKPPCILHGTSIKLASVRLHEGANKCRYSGLQNPHGPWNQHQNSMYPPWNLHRSCIKNVQKVVMQMDVKSIANQSLSDRKKNKNVIACVHFDVAFSGQQVHKDTFFL